MYKKIKKTAKPKISEKERIVAILEKKALDLFDKHPRGAFVKSKAEEIAEEILEK
jgi:hypothetical protein